MARTGTALKNSRLLQAAAVVALIFAARLSKEVLIPIALAVLFSFMLTPLVDRLERWKFPRIPAVLVVVVATFALLGLLGYVVAGQVQDLTSQLPKYTQNIEDKLRKIRGTGGGTNSIVKELEDISAKASSQPTTVATMGGIPVPQPPDPSKHKAPIQQVRIYEDPPPPSKLLLDAAGPVLEIAATAFIIVVLVIFMLIRREDVRDRLIRLISHGQLTVTTQAMTDAAGRVSKYLLMLAIINGTYGVGVWLGLWALGIPNAPLWGLLAAVFRFIPYAGPWIGAALPVIIALAFFPGMGHAALTLALFAVLELVTNGVLEPWLYGAHTGVSPIALLAATVFWAWVWGPVGLILATPLTVLLVVMGKYVPQVEFLSVMLGDEPVFAPSIRFYQRLLASDSEEASEVVEDFLEKGTLDQAYETILIPALRMAEDDRNRGRLDDEKRRYILEAMKEMVEELGERRKAGTLPQMTAAEVKPPATPLGPITEKAPASPPPPAPVRAAAAAAKPVKVLSNGAPLPSSSEAPPPPVAPVGGAERIRVMCLPARDEADELAGLMFEQVLEIAGFNASAVMVAALASEMVEKVEQEHADIVIVTALPPGAITHSRYLCKRLHVKFPKMNVIVALWQARGDVKRAERRIACADSTRVAVTFNDAMEELRQWVPQLLITKDAEKGDAGPRGVEDVGRKPVVAGA